MRIAVIGAGKMGLPLASQMAHRGASVIACDSSAHIVDEVNAGRCPIDEPDVSELIVEGRESGRLMATTDTVTAVARSDVVVVIVPALLTDEPRPVGADLSVLESVSGQIAQGLKAGMMVCYETTVPVGATRSRLLPILETSGLTAGRDFALVFSPERVKSQLVLKNLTRTPKVVGGFDESSARRGEEFYQKYLGAPTMNMGTLEAAELVKLAGMVYRDVNIALVNELARYADSTGIDIERVIEAANSDAESSLLHPGIGVGGHCTPVYPYFLTRDAQRRSVPVTLAERARHINDSQTGYALDQLAQSLGGLQGRKVLILGLSFRPQVKEHSYSTAFIIRDELLRRGAEVYVHDPLYTPGEIRALGFKPGSLDAPFDSDTIVLNTAHAAYESLDFQTLADNGVSAVLDGRNMWDADRIRAAGIAYVGIGRLAVETNGHVNPGIPVARPMLGGEEAEAAANVIRSGWVTQGPEVAAFEREFADYVGSPYACAVSNGTTALHLALLAVGVSPDDEVVTVSHSMIATANSVRYCGAVPVFVDIQPDTFNIDPALIEDAITPRTRAILCVHQMGMPCDLTAISEIARRHDLPLVEDAACAVGSEILWNGAWQKIGKPHGNVACFSFHPRKLLTTGDGGMLTTSNSDWDRNFRLWRQHGMSVPDTVRHGAKEVIFESYDVLGYNYRMTDIQAAVGREQLKRMPGQLRERRHLVGRYRELLGEIPGLILPVEPSWARTNWQSFCVRLPEEYGQRQVMQTMLDSGVSTRRGITCAHTEPAYTNTYGPAHLPWSEQAQKQCLILPLYPSITEAEQYRVAQTLGQSVGQSIEETGRSARSAASV